MKVIIPLLLAVFTLVETGLAQNTLLHPGTDSVQTLSAGSYFYYDSGGENGNYPNNEDVTFTLCPDQPDEIVRVLFTEVDLEIGNAGACLDALEVSGDVNNKDGTYCGNDMGDAGALFRNLEPGTMFESAHGDCLSFRFTSDANVDLGGWAARVDVRAPVPCSCSFDCGQTIVCESFESFAEWQLSPQSSLWRLTESDSGDGVVTSENTIDGNQALRLLNADVSLLLGNRTQGRYRLSWEMYMQDNIPAQYNVQHSETLNHWAFQVKMGDGNGQLFVPNDKNLNPAEAIFSYQPDAWTSFVHIIDVDQDRAELWVNGQFVADWQFSLGDHQGLGPDNLSQLGAVSFSSQVLCYLDAVCVSEVSCPTGACSDENQCAVTVNGDLYNSQCAACCAGYTADEWVELSTTPAITGYSDQREWLDQGNDIELTVVQGDTMLFVDSRAIDTLDFMPGDVELTNYCPDNLSIEVDDQRPDTPTSACYSFEVQWRVLQDGNAIDSVSLPVIVECKSAPKLDSLLFTPAMDTLLAGDTLYLSACPVPDSSDFDFFTTACAGDVQISTIERNTSWSGGQPAAGSPCFLTDLLFIPRQCAMPGDTFRITVAITDNQPPTVVMPADTAVACLTQLDDPVNTGAATGTDTCGVLSVNYVDDLTQLDNCSGMVLRTWTITDSCGNAATGVQRIMVRDTIPPTFTAPDTVAIDSLHQLNDLSLTGMVRNVQDNCGIRDTTYTDDSSGFISCSGIIRRTWTVTDSCGNFTSLMQVIEVTDTEAPRATPPQDITIDCYGDLDNDQLTGTISNVSDNIGVMDTLYSVDSSGLANCTGQILRKWTVRDSCGNTTTVRQAVTIRDTIAPTFVAPFQVTIDCLEELDNLETTGDVLFVTDNCGIRDTSYTDSLTQMADCVWLVRRTWTVTDFCGNATKKVQRIQVADTQGPEFDPPAEARVLESQLQDIQVTGMVLNVSDNCTLSDTVFTDTVVQEATCSAEGWIVRTWRVTDGCGNFTEATQDIYFSLEVPQADAGPDKQISCLEPETELDGSASSLGNRFTYSWTSLEGNFVSGENTPLPQVNAPGTYTLTVVDTTNGCSATDEVLVERLNDLTPNLVSVTDVACNGDSTGMIAIDPQGGNPPYSVRWSTGASGLTLANVPVGQYAVTVTDNGNCEATISASVSQPEPLALQTAVLQLSGCDDLLGSGRAEVVASGGVAPYAYSWDNGDTIAVAGGLISGMHSVVVEDANGCQATAEVNIGEDLPDVILLPLPDLCEGGTAFTLSGGSPAGGSYEGPGISNGRFNPVLAGIGTHEITYRYTAPNGCSGTASNTITVHALPQLTDNGFDPVCINEDTVELNFVSPSGGVYSGPGISNNLLEPDSSGAGSFPVLYTFRDSLTGCSNNLATLVTVEEAAEVKFEISASDTVLCAGDTLAIRGLIENGGDRPVFSWLIDSLPQAADTSFVMLDLDPGRYSIEGAMTTSLACVTATTLTDTLTVTVDSVGITVTPPAGDTLCAGLDSYVLSGGLPLGGTYEGEFVEDSLFLPAIAGPGVHPVTYTAVDSLSGCPVSAAFNLMVEVCTDIELPQAVSRLQLFPNPVKDLFQVVFTGEPSDRVDLGLWDGRGRLVRRKTLRHTSPEWMTEMNVTGLPKGIYWLSTRSDRFLVWRKVIVQ